MSIKKQYLKGKPICKVTFKLASDSTHKARSVHLVGEFNNWDTRSHPMKRLKNGEFTATLELERERVYQFRYLVDENIWENDSTADGFTPTHFGDAENSMIVL